MNCKQIWYNLPNVIKTKLNIPLQFNFNRLPIEVNKFLQEQELNNNTCYLQYFVPNYKTNWFFLIRDLKKICELENCQTNNIIIANTNSFSSNPGQTIGILGNVLVNDTLNGLPVTLSNIFITLISTSVKFLPSITEEGNVNLNSAPSGNYFLSYEICEILNPTNCSSTTVTVTVLP